MEHRYNYFHQNPNSLVNEQSTFNPPPTDPTVQSYDNSGSISSMSSRDQSSFHERKHTNPNAVPHMNSHLYQMDYSNQPPHSSGPPRTNAKGILENSQSTIPCVMNLAQSNAEKYPIDPDFQLQPHLTGFLPQKTRTVPEQFSVDKYSTSKGSIAANMNTNYFSSNKSFPEPKIIEYDLEDTSTETSPQHTSSLYSESTDQDSENTEFNKNTECQVTKKSITVPFSTQEFPVPSQFADLSLNRNDDLDDHQHSIFHSAYNQDDDNTEDIPLSDNIIQNGLESSIENQENPESQVNEQSLKTQAFDYYVSKNDLSSSQFNYKNKHRPSPYILDNKFNHSHHSNIGLSNTQNPQFNKGLYFSQSNTLCQPSSLNSSIPQLMQNKPIFSYSNTEIFSPLKESSNVQNSNDGTQSGDYNKINKHVQPVFQNTNVPSFDYKLQSNVIDSNTQDKQVLNQSTSQVQTFNSQNSNQSNSSSTNNLSNEQNIQNTETNSHHSSNTFTSELLNTQPMTCQQFTPNNLLTSTQSVDPTNSAASILRSSSSVSEAVVQENHNTYQTSNDHSNSLYKSYAAESSSIDVINQDLVNNEKSEFDIKLSQPSSNYQIENQQEKIDDQILSSYKQSSESLQDLKLSSPPPIRSFTQANNFFEAKNTSLQQESNVQPSSRNQFSSSFDKDNNISSDQFSNNPVHFVPHSTNNQNKTIQRPLSTTGHGVSHYFDSVNANNQNIQSHSQPQIVHGQDMNSTISNIQPSKNSNNFMSFSDNQNKSDNVFSSNQQPPPVKTELEVTNSLKLDSNVALKETTTLNPTISSHLKDSALIQTKNLNMESLENNEVMTFSSKASDNITPNDQFSNMTIDSQQNIPVSKTFNQEQTIPASYFSKNTTINKEDNSILFQNFSSTVHNASNIVPEVSEIKNTSQVTDTLSLNPNQSPANQFSSQLSSNKVTLNTIPPVSSVTNQISPQMSSNRLQSDNIAQPIHQFINQSVKNVDSLASNNVSPQMFSNRPITNTEPSQSTLSPYPTQPFNNQPISNMVTPVSLATNPLPPQRFSSNQSKTNTELAQSKSSLNPTMSIDKQLTPNIFSPALPVINQFPPQMLNTQAKLEVMPPIQPVASGYAVQQFNNQLTKNTVPVVSSITNQIPQIFDNSSKSNTIPPFQPALNSVPSATSTTIQQMPQQMFNNQSKQDVSTNFKSTSKQFPPQPLNNQQKSNIVPLVPSAAHQLPSQMNNPLKSNVPPIQVTPNQFPPQPFNNQPRPNIISPVTSTANQFPSQNHLSNHHKLNDTSNKLAASRYPTQTLSNQPMSGILPTQQATSQYVPQPFNNQPSQQISSNFNTKPNHLYNPTTSQPVHNQWPPHPSINQLNQQSSAPFPSANFSNQNNPMFPPPNILNSSSNLIPSANQKTQMLGSQMLSSNPLSSNNYFNQAQGIGNALQSQQSTVLPGRNVQIASKGYPQQSNLGFSNQINYHQSVASLGQQGYHNQQQDMHKPEQHPSVVQQGFAKTWGYDNIDLLKSRDVLPGDGVEPPEIKLPQGYENCENCSPDIFRCTLNKFPSSKTLLEKSRLPLGILIHPFKDLSCLTVVQCDTITRCRNCRSYINPFVQFIDNAHWKCNLCYRVNELPGEFQIDPFTKTLGDPLRRPEIQNATIEYIASQDYMVRPPQPALYLFLLDVSRTATLTGYLEIVCDRILNKILDNDIPGDSRTNIGFITFDSSVHFYQIANSDGGQPKQLIVSDISDIFLPLPDGLMVNLEENKSAIKDLLTNLPNHYRESYNTGCALGAALQAAFKILAPRGGRITVFQSSLPNCGPGSLQPRDDGKPHTGDRVQHMVPATDFYKKLALDCSAEQIAVDMFFISSQYLDIATISGISKYSAGCLYNFPQFNVKSPTIVTRFINCFDRYLSRKIGFEALLRLRCTRGVAVHSFHGNFFVRSSDLLMLPNVNPDNAYGMQLSIEDNLDGVTVVCFQAALLYTSSNAERRIRVHTLCIPVTDNLNDVFHNADQQAITCLISKMAVDRSTEKSLSDAREAFINAISDSLSAFKLGCSSYNGLGTMLSPMSLKVFPLYILAMMKHAAFRTNQPTQLDDRMFSMCQMKSLPLNSLIQYIYPDLYPIHTLEEQPKIDYEKLTEIPLPPVIQLSAERIESNGIYLMDDSETITIFIGNRCSDQLVQKLFGYVNISSMPELITTLAEVDSKPSYLLRSFIDYLQNFKPYPLPIEIIKDNGPHKLRFYSRLIEDKFESSLSYYEFLQRVSQQVR